MLGRALLWGSEKARIKRMVTEGKWGRRVVERFVAGDKLEDAVRVIQGLNERSIGGILDLLGEGVADPGGAQAAADEYLASIKRVAETGIDTTVAVKLSQLGLSFDKGACIDHFRLLAAEAQANGTTIEIDMEQSALVTDTIDVYRLMRPDFPTLRMAMQAYLRRTPLDLENLVDIPPRIRLVKGAYAEDPKIAFQKGHEIDQQYRFLTEWLFRKGADPAIATHDSSLIEQARVSAEKNGKGLEDFELQFLYGIRRELQERLAQSGYRVRVYVPFGSAWYEYLMRRMAERPANIRFFLRAMARD
jgi:proline dehydrogenase